MNNLYHILYVDDEAFLLDIASQFLQKEGNFFVTTAQSVDEAVELLENEPFDAIISDYMMPDRNGIDFLIYLREQGNQIPFILFTGRGREEIAIDALNNGADFYVQKGGSPKPQFAELVHKIRVSVDRHRLQNEIIDKQQTIEEIFRHLPDPTFAIDQMQKVVAWNRGMEVLTGISATDIIGKGDYLYSSWYPGIPGPVLADYLIEKDVTILENYCDVVLEENTLTAKSSFIDTKGKKRILWIKASRIICQGGGYLGVIESIRDITQQEKIVEDLVQVRSELEDIINFLPDATFIIDTSGTIVFWNHAMERITGYPKKEVIGKKRTLIAEKGYGKDFPMLIDLVISDNLNQKKPEKVMNNDRQIYFRETFLPSFYDGKGANIWATAAPLFDKEGMLIGAIESVRDITQIKKNEKDLRLVTLDLATAYEQIRAQEDQLRGNQK